MTQVTQHDLMRDSGFIPATDAATAIGVHVATVYRWIDSGRVAGTRAGGSRYVSVNDLLDMYISAPAIQKRIRAVHAARSE